MNGIELIRSQGKDYAKLLEDAAEQVISIYDAGLLRGLAAVMRELPTALERDRTEIARLQEVIKANNYAQDITLREAGAQLTEVAAFLDVLAHHMTRWPAVGNHRKEQQQAATDCREMAERLRGYRT